MMSKLSSMCKKRILYAVIIAVGILLDQITKLLAVRYLKPVGSFPLWKGVFHLRYVENPGAAFGMLENHPWVFMVFSTVAILLLGFYLFWGKSYLSEKDERGGYPEIDWFSGVAIALIVTGGIGNMIDRIATRILYQRGFVVDFFDFALIDFAVFNVADSFVTVGAVLLALSLVLSIIKEQKKKEK